MLIIKGCVSNLGQKCECRIVLMLLFTVNGAFDFGLKYYPPRSNSEIVADCFRPLELFDFFPTPLHWETPPLHWETAPLHWETLPEAQRTQKLTP